jgi:hypothetical protein
MKKLGISIVLLAGIVFGYLSLTSKDKSVVVKKSVKKYKPIQSDQTINKKITKKVIDKKVPVQRKIASHSKKRIIKNKGKALSKKSFQDPLYSYFSTSKVGLVVNDTNLILSDSLKAIDPNDHNGEDVLKELAGYYIVRHDYQNSLTENDHIRVVYNKSTKRVGLLTGKVLLRAQQPIGEEMLEQEFGLATLSSITHLKLTVAKIESGTSLAGLEQKLNQSGYFDNVELEIIEGDIRAN